MRIHFKSNGKHRIVDLDTTFDEFIEAGKKAGEEPLAVLKDTMAEMNMPVDGAIMVEL